MWPSRVGAIVAHEIRLMRRDPMPPLILIVFPLIVVAFLEPTFRLVLVADGFRHANGAEQAVPGEAVVNGFAVVGLVSFAFFNEHGWNTWERLLASNATTLEIVVGKALPRLALSIAQFAIIFALAGPMFDLHIQGPALALVPLVVAFGVCLVTLGVLSSALCRTVAQAGAFAFGGLVLFGAIGGALVPISVIPGWARAIAPATPTYWAMRGFRDVILTSGGFGVTVAPVAVLLMMSALFVAVSLVTFRVGDVKTAFG